MRIVAFIIMLFASATAAVTLTPYKQITVAGAVKDLVLHNNRLVVATDSGVVQIYDYSTDKITKSITLPKIKDFAGDRIAPRIFSVDATDSSVVFVSDSGKSGYVNVWLYENNTTTQLIDAAQKIVALKVRFITKDKILLGLLSNEALLWDIKTKKALYRVQLSASKFSDFALNEDRSQAVFACESGILYLIDTQSGKVLKELKGINVDNVFKVDFKKGIVAGAGQDRRAAIYNLKTGKSYYIKGDFLIYATALSPSAQKVAFSMDEQNTITVFNTATKATMAQLKGQKSTLNSMVFKDETTLFSASDDDTIMVWRVNTKE